MEEFSLEDKTREGASYALPEQVSACEISEAPGASKENVAADAGENEVFSANEGENEVSSTDEGENVISTANEGKNAINAAEDGEITMPTADEGGNVDEVNSGARAFFKEAINKLKRFKSPRFSAAYVAKMAILVAISFLLYYLGRFVKLPFMFPSFFDMQISELPALLAGFSLGPISGCLVIIFKCLLKLPLTSTMYVGELTDMLLGVAFVLPASVVYRARKDKQSRKSGIKAAIIGLCAGSVLLTGLSLVVNRFISVPFYTKLYFEGNFKGLVEMLGSLYKGINEDNFYTFYLLLGVLPFNLLRCIIVSLLTFLLYKRLSVLLHWEGVSLLKKSVEGLNGAHLTRSVKETYALADRVAEELEGGEIILLDGELGAGKTTFTKGLAAALGIKDEVTSPTFGILNVYEGGRLKLNHLDMYRIESEDEISELGIEDCFDSDAVTVIEWNKFETLPGKVIRIKAEYADGENERLYTITLSDDEKRAEHIPSADCEEKEEHIRHTDGAVDDKNLSAEDGE